jgi:hypothetical protein
LQTHLPPAAEEVVEDIAIVDEWEVVDDIVSVEERISVKPSGQQAELLHTQEPAMQAMFGGQTALDSQMQSPKLSTV